MTPTILLISPEGDPAVQRVKGHLHASGARVLHLHDRDPIVEVSLRLSPTEESATLRTHGGLRLSLGEVDACWFHRGALMYARTSEAYREAEWASVQACIRGMLADRPSLGELRRLSGADRLLQLRAARAAGLTIPDTAIVNHPEAAARAVAWTGPAVTKAISHGVFGATRVAQADAVPPGIPTLIQARQPRMADLRVFYLDGACWGMAIFPYDEGTVDWRIDGYEGGRPVPYRPAPSVQRAIRRLMDALALDTGSLDFILRPDGGLCFLEVNPSGQFSGMPCGTDLTRRVAEALLARAAGRAPARPPLPERDPEPLREPVIRLHAGCTWTEDGRLVDAELQRAVDVPVRFLERVEAGATRAQLREAFGEAGLVLADALLQAKMAFRTRHPACFPRSA